VDTPGAMAAMTELRMGGERGRSTAVHKEPDTGPGAFQFDVLPVLFQRVVH
jgi:hypothetical protein